MTIITSFQLLFLGKITLNFSQWSSNFFIVMSCPLPCEFFWFLTTTKIFVWVTCRYWWFSCRIIWSGGFPVGLTVLVCLHDLNCFLLPALGAVAVPSPLAVPCPLVVLDLLFLELHVIFFLRGVPVKIVHTGTLESFYPSQNPVYPSVYPFYHIVNFEIEMFF